MNNLRDKKPHQLTKAEFQEHGAAMFDVDTLSCVDDDWVLHEKEVELALEEGLTVPERVLADYPHLKKENR